MAAARCPICSEPLREVRGPEGSSPLERFGRTFPFCSERCRLVDLGRWLEEDYRVPDREDEGYRDDAEGRDES